MCCLRRLRTIKKELKQRETDLTAKERRRKLEREQDGYRTKKLGKTKFIEPTVAVKLSEELQGSLPLLKVLTELL